MVSLESANKATATCGLSKGTIVKKGASFKSRKSHTLKGVHSLHRGPELAILADKRFLYEAKMLRSRSGEWSSLRLNGGLGERACSAGRRIAGTSHD
jgi:hypothetical protein